MELRKNENEPIYDDKVKNVIRLLTEGIDREEIAKQMGYSNYKSLDMYIRRRNFHWDSDNQNYVPNYNRFEGTNLEDTIASTSKAAQVIALFSKEGADPKIIAKRLGYADHREMAFYMSGKGYQWSSEKKNYIKAVGIIEESEVSPAIYSEDSNSTDQNNENIVEIVSKFKSNSNEQIDLQQFVPLLMMLQKNRDRLVDILMPQSDAGTIPRYALPGVFVTKSVHMVSPLDMMVRDFSREKNVSQRDIFAAALLEFFRKYGYEREIEHLLNSK